MDSGARKNARLGRIIEILAHAWTPHSGQVPVGKAVFKSPADMIYVECGRKFGKSECGAYICWLYAATTPNAEVYYLAPAVKQARELVWANNRIQTCNTYRGDFIRDMEKAMGGEIKILNQEMRIILPNGSFIKVDGSDNYNSQRGLKPDLVVADEYRDFKAEWIEAVRPNMSVKRGKILFITTPPHGPNHAYEMAQECKEAQAAGDKHYFYVNMPSYVNDRIPGHKEWLEKEKAALRRTGKWNQWRREYMAEYITADEHAVIPMLNRDIFTENNAIQKKIANFEAKNLEFRPVMAINPVNTTQFAALWGIYSEYTAEIMVIQEYYTSSAEHSGVLSCYDAVMERAQQFWRGLGLTTPEYDIIVNTRTPWAARDITDARKVPCRPASRALRDPTHNVGLIKDMLVAKSLIVGEDCKQLIKESEMYQRSKTTLKIANDPQPLIDCLRMLVEASGFTVDRAEMPEALPPAEDFLTRLQASKSFEYRMRELRAEEHGVLMEDDDMYAHLEDDITNDYL